MIHMLIPGRFVLLACFSLGFRVAYGQAPRTIRVTDGPLTAVVVFQDSKAATHEADLRAFLPAALSRYRALFGGPPRDATARALDTVTLTLTSAPVGEGSADFGRVQAALGEVPAFGFYDWRLMVLHELFHLWNGTSMQDATSSEQWFSEGITEFYAMQTAAGLGLIQPLQAVNITASALGLYASATDLGKVSLTDAATPPEMKFRRYFLVYGGGWMAGLVLDHDIRTRTRGARSLDDVMRRMYRTFVRQPYTTAQVASTLRTATDLDYTDFFARHIRGSAPIPVAEYLNLGDLAFALTARAARVPAPARLRPVDTHLLASLGLGPTTR